MAVVRKRKNKKRHRLVLFILIILFIIALGSYFLINYRPLSNGHVDANINASNPNKSKAVNILVCGVDSDPTRIENQFLTDVMMLINLNMQDNKISVLQIPRDTYVGDSIPSKKMNAAYNLGPDQNTKINNVIDILDNQFKIKVDHYLTITMSDFRNVIDEIGGVTINIPYSIPKDNGVDTSISLPQGENFLDGAKAEVFVRYRKGYTEGDTGRVKAQRYFLSAVSEKLKQGGIFIVPRVVGALSSMQSDMSVGDMATYGYNAMKIDQSDIEMYMLPGIAGYKDSLSYWSVNRQALADLLNAKFRPFDDKVSASSLGVYEIIDSDSSVVINNGNSVQDILDGAKSGVGTTNVTE